MFNFEPAKGLSWFPAAAGGANTRGAGHPQSMRLKVVVAVLSILKLHPICFPTLPRCYQGRWAG
jgi:hypothetical protein